MRSSILILVAVIILCAHRIQAGPVEVRILSDSIVLEIGKTTTVRCVLQNTTSRDLVVPVGESIYYQADARNADGTPLPLSHAIMELADPVVEDFVVLGPGAEYPFALSIKTAKPTQRDFEFFKTRKGVAVLSDRVGNQFLCPRHFHLYVRAYGPDQSNSRSVRRKIGKRFWDGDLLSGPVSARIK